MNGNIFACNLFQHEQAQIGEKGQLWQIKLIYFVNSWYVCKQMCKHVYKKLWKHVLGHVFAVCNSA